MNARKQVTALVLAGFLLGFTVLGLGGRFLMRVLAFITPEAPRFTLYGTFEIVAAGAVWGALTAPLLIVTTRWESRLGWFYGPAFGLLIMILAIVVFVPVSGFDGRIDAPSLFVVGTLTLFPVLFILYGVLIHAINRRGSHRN